MKEASHPIYLDYASTAPVHPLVRQSMDPYLRQEFGNPSSLSPLGRRAAEARERARAQVAGALGCHDDEGVFTSGGSESDNPAPQGGAPAQPSKRHPVPTPIEHNAAPRPA